MGRNKTGETKDRILLFMNSWTEQVPIPRSVIVENVGGTDNNIAQRLIRLKKEGYVSRGTSPWGSGWTLIDKGRTHAGILERQFGKWPLQEITRLPIPSSSLITSLPYVGGVRAGAADYFQPDPDAQYECGFDPDTHVAMTVLSDSMEHRRIYKGCTIIVKLVDPSQEIPPGAIAVLHVPVGTDVVGDDEYEDLKDAALRDADPQSPPLEGITLKEWTGTELRGKDGRRKPFKMEPYGIVRRIIQDLDNGFTKRI